MHGKIRNIYKVLVRKPEKKKYHLEYLGINRIHLVQDRNQEWDLVNMRTFMFHKRQGISSLTE
jgi:hypothetical protein